MNETRRVNSQHATKLDDLRDDLVEEGLGG